MKEGLNLIASVRAAMAAGANMSEACNVEGRYSMQCHDADGKLLWSEEFDNVVTTVGQNQLLTSGVVGSTPAFMGLISSISFSTPLVTDTMTSHSEWLEADDTNAPEYSGNRPTLGFGTPSAGSIATTGTTTFTFTNSGSVAGAFVVFGSGAVSTQASTTGILLSAGAFSAGTQPVISGNTVTVSYQLNA
jgi:hypothetical protein